MTVQDDLDRLVDQLDEVDVSELLDDAPLGEAAIAARDDVTLAQLRRQIRLPVGGDAADGQPQP